MRRPLLRALSVLVPLGALVVIVVVLLSMLDDGATPELLGGRPSDLPTSSGDGSSSSDTTAVDVNVADQPADNGDADTVLETTQPQAPTDARAARVVRLADGDSFDIEWLDSGQRDEIRLFGINAPERDACYGDTARDVLDDLTNDKTVLVEDLGQDDFWRTLGNVWVDDQFVNLTLVEWGAALAQSGGGGTHSDLMANAQTFAQDAAIGLWDPEFCGASQISTIRISRIESDAPGRDDQNPNGEWIELINEGAASNDLTDWSIRDESTRHRYFFPDGFVLPAGESVRVYSGCGDDSFIDLYWCDGDPIWNNGGDTGFLVDADGKFVDTRSYGG